MLHSPEFVVSQEPRIMKLARFKVSDLGFNKWATIQEIYEESQKLGLELCPPEVGPLLRLHHVQYFGQEQPDMGIMIGMKPIASRDGDPRVFEVRYHSDGKWALDGSDARSQHKYHPDKEFVFMRQ